MRLVSLSEVRDNWSELRPAIHVVLKRKMNTDITASTKPEYPVLDRNPPFTRVVGNFSTLDYFRFATITGVSVTVGYLSGISLKQPLLLLLFPDLKFKLITSVIDSIVVNTGIKPGIRGPSMVTGGLIGLMGGFMYAYQNSAGRIMGFFPNDNEVAHYKKWNQCPLQF